MNNERRKRLANAIANLEDAKNELESIREEEQASYNNLPEGLQSAELGEKLDDNVNNLEDAISSIEEAINSVNDM